MELDENSLKRSRNLSHNKPHSFIFVHNQSNIGGDVDPDTKTIPIGQAGDANSILLGNKHDIIVTTLPVDPVYLLYFSETLKLTVPQIFTPPKFTTDLVQSLQDCKEDFVAWVRQKQQEGKVKEELILSVFEADERDIELLSILQKAGIPELVSECNYELLTLGNKDGFRDFCRQNSITQLPGGTFRSIEEVEKFIAEQHSQGHTVVVKSPHGIGGGGQVRLRPTPTGESPTVEWKETVAGWLKKEKAVEAEHFADTAESEHVVDIYIDPSDQHHTAVLFDQLVRNDNASAGMAYYGALYPSKKHAVQEKILEEVEKTVAPALAKAGYRGPAGVDVLWNPLHFMELNMRTDAITYVKHLTDRIGKNIYKSEPGTTAFMSLVNLPLSLSLKEVIEKHGTALAPSKEGIFALSNPNRQRWGFYDVVAISPNNLKEAEEVMERGLVGIWGKEKADEFMRAIYRPHPQLNPELEGPLPCLVTLPRDYIKSDKTQKWPMILFLHGMGERGTGLTAIREHGIPKVTLADRHFKFIGVCPQLPLDQEVWDVPKLIEIIDKVEKEYPIDTEREYVTGMSMGGHGTWAMALAQPNRFAAIAPICGDAHEDIEMIDRIKHLPVWAFHGTDDEVVPFGDTKQMVRALRESGNDTVKFTKYEGGTHDAWTETYANPDLYDWFLSHKRDTVQQ